MPAQVLLYAFLLGNAGIDFSPLLRPAVLAVAALGAGGIERLVRGGCGVMVAVAVMVASVLLRTPDIDSPMKSLLSDPASVLMIAIIGTTLAPVCEEIVFRGFLQPLLVRSLGAAPGILLAAAAFGLMHLQEYGYSWRHGLLITLAGRLIRLDAPAHRIDQGRRHDARHVQRCLLSAAGRAAGRVARALGGTWEIAE
jgi:membrane protease YdiL (CAAX protease family)